MGLRDRIRRLEHSASGPLVTIPQQDGTVEMFSERDLTEAFMSNVRRLKSGERSGAGEATERQAEHPLVVAAANSSDPKWRDSFYGRLKVEPGETEDLSE